MVSTSTSCSKGFRLIGSCNATGERRRQNRSAVNSPRMIWYAISEWMRSATNER